MFHRVLLAALLAALALAVAAPSAHSDGLPIPVEDAGPTGIAVPGSESRYTARRAGRGTILDRVHRDSGRLLGSLRLRGTFTVPAVALDGSASGLSADGRTLVLIRPRPQFPRAQTTFAIVDARELRLRKVIRLDGDFSFDAISPDGTVMYLVEYTSTTDPTRYAVRAYDLEAGRLLNAPVVDKREPDEQMRGFPVTRLAGRDGRWAYTLYDGNGEHPFVHALDTTDRRAVCIDLHGLAGRRDLQTLGLRLSADESDLAVVAAGGPVALVDTRTFEPRRPGAVRPAPADPPDGDGRATPFETLGALGAGLLVLSLVRRRRAARRRSAV